MSVTTNNPVEILRSQLTRMDPEFRTALPGHIKSEKFRRVVMTVCQQQPDLLQADRGTLLAACTSSIARRRPDTRRKGSGSRHLQHQEENRRRREVGKGSPVYAYARRPPEARA